MTLKVELMDKLYVFQNIYNIRVLGTWKQPLFVALDICKVLGLKCTTSSLLKIPGRDKCKQKIYNGRRFENTNLLTEPGLYRLIMRSNKPIAIQFQDWIYYEVIPSIRQYGEYLADEQYRKCCREKNSLEQLIDYKEEIIQDQTRLIKGFQKKQLDREYEKLEKNNPYTIPIKMTKQEKDAELIGRATIAIKEKKKKERRENFRTNNDKKYPKSERGTWLIGADI